MVDSWCWQPIMLMRCMFGVRTSSTTTLILCNSWHLETSIAVLKIAIEVSRLQRFKIYLWVCDPLLWLALSFYKMTLAEVIACAPSRGDGGTIVIGVIAITASVRRRLAASLPSPICEAELGHGCGPCRLHEGCIVAHRRPHATEAGGGSQ